MSRTDAHTPWWVALDNKPWRGPRGDQHPQPEFGTVERQQWYQSGPSWREMDRYFSRRGMVHWYQQQENRKSRRRARVALHRGDYDSLPTHETGRHSADWLAY
jgi:hypothetical protein